MNRTPQSDVHPDADVLNAFVERALPAAERGRIMEHMAECAACRDIVYLASMAAEDESERGRGSAAVPAPTRRRFSSAVPWLRPAWISVGAMAALAALVVWVQLRPADHQAESVRNAGPAAAQTDRADMSVSNTPAPDVIPEPSSPDTRTAQPRNDKARLQSMPTRKESPNLAGSRLSRADRGSTGFPGMEPKLPSPAMQPNFPGSPEFAAGNDAVANSPAEEAVVAGAERPRLKAGPAAEWGPVTAAQTLPRHASEAQSTRPVLSAGAPLSVHGVAMGPVAPPPAPSLAGSATAQLARPPQPVNGLAAFHLARPSPLPSGLPTMSSAAGLERQLALDADGGVFLSRDAGRHWERVPAQWTGKAVAVRAQPRNAPLFPPTDLTEASAAVGAARADAAPSSVDAAPPPPAPSDANAALFTAPTLFRLTTDRHQTWVSADGKTWRLQ